MNHVSFLTFKDLHDGIDTPVAGVLPARSS